MKWVPLKRARPVVAIKEDKPPPLQFNFAVLTKAYLESSDQVEKAGKVASDELYDEEIQMEDILKKWKAGDKSSATTPSKLTSDTKADEPNRRMETRTKLPNRVKIDDSMLGIPLEDVDPYYRKSRSTFIVVGRDRTLTRFSVTDALFLFSPFNPLRKAALYILVHPIFSLLVILTILCNCVFMAMNSPPEIAEYIFTSVYTIEAVVKIFARGFFLAPFTYIRDAWNVLDFMVITLAYVTSFVELGNLAILRTFRVLRALKTVAIVPGLKTIVGALLEAVRRLRDVAFLTLFMLSIFALVGLQLYMGELSNKCILRTPLMNGSNGNETSLTMAVTTELPLRRKSTVIPALPVFSAFRAKKRRNVLIGYVNSNYTSYSDDSGTIVRGSQAATLISLIPRFGNIKASSKAPKTLPPPPPPPPPPSTSPKSPTWQPNIRIVEGELYSTTAAEEEWIHDNSHWLEDNEIGYVVCRPGKCPYGYVCIESLGSNPDFGFTSFDNYGWAMFSGFRLMTQDCWERLFHQIILACGVYHVVYFMLVIFLGSFYLINLILAIVAMSYQDLQMQEEAAALEEREDEEAERRMAQAALLEDVFEDQDKTMPDPNALLRQKCEKSPEEMPKQPAQRSFEVGTPQSVRKMLRRRNAMQTGSRRSSWTHTTGGESLTGSQMTSTSTNSISKSVSSRTRRIMLATGGSTRVSLPYLDDSQAMTPTSETLYQCDFHISDYILAIQKLTAGSQYGLNQAGDEPCGGTVATGFTSGIPSYAPPRIPSNIGDSRSASHDHQTNAQLQPWRLTSLHRASLSIEDEDTSTLRPPAPSRRRLERRHAIDDASSIHAVDVFNATPRRHRKIPIPMVDDSLSKLGNSTANSSRLSVQTLTEQKPVNLVATATNTGEVHHQIVIELDDGETTLDDDFEDEDETSNQIIEPPCVVFIKRCWNSRVRQMFEKVVNDPFVDLFITICILVNTLFMALDRHGMSQDLFERLRYGNYFFTSVFATEAVLKVVAFSPCKYFTDSWNVFDFFIVFLSLVELGLEGVQGLSVLRTFRLLRVFKLARSWPTLNLLIGIIGRTLGALGNLTFVLGIIVFIFAVMGMQLFGKSYRQNVHLFPDGELPRWHFLDFTHSFMIVFRVLCGEWVESLWDCMVVYGWPCIPFFILTLVVGNLVVLNLFLALLLDSFSTENIKSIMEEKSNDPNKLNEALDRFSRFFSWIKRRIAALLHIQIREDSIDARTLEQTLNMMVVARRGAAMDRINVEEQLNRLGLSTTSTRVKFSEGDESKMGLGNAASSSTGTTMHRSTTLPSIRQKAISLAPHLNRLRALSAASMVGDCFPKCCYERFPIINRVMQKPTGIKLLEFRRKACKVIEDKYFESAIIFLIVLSSITLAIEDVNSRQNPTLMSVLQIMDKCFNVIFTVEMLLKWMALGFRRYFSDGWCWLDFIIVTVSLISWIAEGAGLDNLGAFRALRTLRALRPLRAVSRWEGMKIVVNALLQAIPSICNVFLVCIVFWLIFSIMGVQLFAGKFYKCVDDEGERLSVDIVSNKTECLAKNFTWANSKINFDDVGHAYLALLQVATFSGWIEIIADAVDSVELDQQPYREASLYFYFYFVLFIIFGSFFTLNLFIGVIIENFNKQKKRSGGSIELFMTEDQKKYYNAMKKLKHKSPQKPIPKPKNIILNKLFYVVTDQRFEVFIMIIIVANMLLMCLEHHQQPQLLTNILSYANMFFIGVFAVEFLLKLIAFRQYYFTQPWNLFDCIVVILSIVASALADYMADFPISPTILRVVRVFRVGRVLRLVKAAKGIRTLLFSLAVSLPALFNIGLLLLLVIFIYACFGMSFFMNVKLTEGFNEQFNFKTIVNSMLLLFQLATSAGWDGVMLALLNDEPPGCDPTPTKFAPHGDCSNSTLAIFYLVSYVMISFMVVVNMYIAVILENFGEATQDVQQGLTQDDFDAFFEKWERFDPKATQYIGVHQLSALVDALEPPLRIPMPNWRAIVILDPPVCTDMRVHCDDVVTMLVRSTLAGSVSHAAETPDLDLDAILSKDKPDYEVLAYLSQIDTAARRIQRKWRRKYLNMHRGSVVPPHVPPSPVVIVDECGSIATLKPDSSEFGEDDAKMMQDDRSLTIQD